MSEPAFHRSPDSRADAGAALREPSHPAEVLAAGARARALADGCDALDLGAVLLDAAGCVLYAAPRAVRAMGKALRIEAGHVLAGTAVGNEVIESVLNPILGAGATQQDGVLGAVVPVEGEEGLFLAAFGYRDGLPGQLLRAVLLVDRSAATLATRVAALLR